MSLPSKPPARAADLSKNARTVLEKRYLVKDATGKPTETPEQLFWRVATVVAEADRRYGASEGAVETVAEEFYRLMTERRFEPNSPTLMNAGRPLGQLSACFPAGTMVSTEQGAVPIEQVAEGTMVLTHRGHYRPVTQTMRRQGALYRVKVDKLPDMLVTAEHPVLTLRGWVMVRDLEATRDFVQIGALESEDLDAPVIDFGGAESDGWVYQPNRDRRVRSGPLSSQVAPLKAGVVVDEDVAWLLGFYVAEGSISAGYDLRFVMCMDEEGYAERVVTTLRERFGLDATTTVTERETSWRTVRAHSKLFSSWLDQEFGHGFAGKRLPTWLMRASRTIQTAFLRGVADGDGTPVNAHQTRVVLANEQLVRQLFEMACRLECCPSLAKVCRPAGATEQPWSVTFGPTHDQGMVREGCYRVREVEPLDRVEEVYNFEVEEDHTYVANQVVVHNCFVLPVEDALSNGRDGIYDTLRSMALIHQSGGGTGFGFSRLRAKGSMVRSTTGVASGPISFMQLYDASTDAVKQGGTRRGANMGILRVDHPDILEFIACKEDITKIVNFNISVAVTDSFMAAVKAGTSYDLIDPVSKQVTGQLDARMVWDKMILGAWRTGEPGCFFIDEANRYNPVPHLGSYEATNPCVIGSTRLATDRGLLTMEELCRDVTEIRVVTDDRVPAIRAMLAGGGVAVRAKRGTTLRYAVPVFKTRENAPVFKLVTSHGYTVTATDNHKFFTPTGPVALADLKVGDDILLQSGEGAWSTDYALPAFEPDDKLRARAERGEAHLPTHWSRELGQLLGWTIADGWTSEELPEARTEPNYTVGLLFGGDEKPLAETFRSRVRHWTGMEGNLVERPGRLQLMYKSGLYDFLRSLGINAPGAEKHVPESIWRAPREAVIGFLQAMFTADGTVNIGLKNRSYSVRLSASNKVLLQEVQLLLLNFGIVSHLYLRRKAHDKSMPDGHGGARVYACAEQYELVLYKENCDRFVRTIGFIAPAKQQKIERYLKARERAAGKESFVTRVHSITPAGHEDVYCTTEPATHSIVVSGCVTTNCGEQPLLPYDVCNLGSINVGYYVKNGVMDWEALRRDIHLSTHFLDNIIDVNKYPLPEIDALSKRIRRIGLGLMGFADMLIRLGIPYDSDEGVEMGRRVMEFLDVESKRESERLANERGPFPDWARSIWGPNETCAFGADGQRIRPRQMLRNCNVTTVAPTGTISIIAGCSSGLEPLFAVAFMRNQAGAMMPDVNEDFVAVAKAEGWYSDDLMERIAKEGHIGFPEVPEKWQRVFVTANQIAPEWHMRMQAAFQQHCDSAISKTTNFAHTATADDVRAIYEMAYDMKAKGVTVYRDGSRDNQVLSTGATATAKAVRDGTAAAPADKREVAELKGSLAERNAEIERLKKALYEVEAENLQRRAKRARPDKLRGTTTRMETPLGTMFVNITEDDRGQPFEVFITLGKAGGAAMADAEAMGRLISLALRSGIPITSVHKQLRGIASDRPIGLGPNKVLSVPDAIGMAIEGWWRDKQGVQQELLADHPTTPKPATPAIEQVTTTPNTQQVQLSFDSGSYSETFMATCPDCGSQLEYAEGCVKCHVCGFSECG